MKKSKIFWNIIPIVLQIVIGIYSIETLFVIQCILCVVVIIIGINNLSLELDEDYIPFPLFLWFTLLGFPCLFLYFIYRIIKWLYNNPISKFNTWLDTEKVKRMSFSKFKKEKSNG